MFVLTEYNLKNYDKNNKKITYKFNNKNLNIYCDTLKKFSNDKNFCETKDFLVIFDGVLFNKKELNKKYGTETIYGLITEMYKKNGERFCSEFRGTFYGVFIDKRIDLILVYTDQIGNKKIYYSENFPIIAGSNLYDVADYFVKNNRMCTLDKRAAYSLLTHGAMLDNLTLVNEIKMLKGGQYLKIVGNKLSIERYHKFCVQQIDEKNENEIIEKIDFLFKQAVRRQYEKNKEYGYLNIAPLSAGLDSGATNFVLKDFCDDKVINITYSQNNYQDETVPKKIADVLKNHWIFKSLNNGLSLYLFEETSKITFGQCNSYGAAQVLDFIKYFNSENVGIIHTGMFGECLAGGEAFDKEISYLSIMLKNKMEIFERSIKFEKFDNFEIFNYYNGSFLRSFMGSPKVFQEISDSFSPFYDVDFLQYTANIPAEIRKNHNIYDKWLLKKYPKACQYLHNGRKIGEKYIKVLGREIPKSEVIPKIIKYILRKMKLQKDLIKTEKHMNPLDYWYENNENLKYYLDGLYSEYIELLKDNELKEDCKILYNTGNAIEKDLVLTLLISYNNIFDKNNLKGINLK